MEYLSIERTDLSERVDVDVAIHVDRHPEEGKNKVDFSFFSALFICLVEFGFLSQIDLTNPMFNMWLVARSATTISYQNDSQVTPAYMGTVDAQRPLTPFSGSFIFFGINGHDSKWKDKDGRLNEQNDKEQLK